LFSITYDFPIQLMNQMEALSNSTKHQSR
jgi:hypothetical protein